MNDLFFNETSLFCTVFNFANFAMRPNSRDNHNTNKETFLIRELKSSQKWRMSLVFRDKTSCKIKKDNFAVYCTICNYLDPILHRSGSK